MSKYKHQEACRFIAAEGQQRLESSTVLIVGVGGLGSNVAMSLARMGVGNLVLCDTDRVSWSNLHRQHYSEGDVGSLKVNVLSDQIRAANRDVEVNAYFTRIEADNIESYGRTADVIIDATDTIVVRILINKYAYEHGKPWIYGGCAGIQGMFATFIPGRTPCFGCVFGDSEITATMAANGLEGILPPVVNLVANWQAIQAVKVLTRQSTTDAVDPLLGKLVLVNGWTGRTVVVNTMNAAKDVCPYNCGDMAKRNGY